MKIVMTASNVKVLTKDATLSQDGQNTYYKIGIMNGSELGTVSCSKDVYESVGLEEVYDLTGVYNSEYKSFKFEKVAKASMHPATTPGGATK